MASEDMVGVILAAGRGSRIQPFSTRYPKPILPVCNKPIIEHQIGHMVALGIKEVIIVVGHLGYEIARVLGDGHQLGVKIQYAEQKEILGIAHAVAGLESLISKPFMLFLGDIFFDTLDLALMVKDLRERELAAVIAVKEESDRRAIQRNFAVLLNEENLVKRVIEKPRYTNNRLKGCGLYLFDLPIFDAIRRTPRTAMRDEYEITDSIQILIEDGYRVSAAAVISDDINLTFPQDLLECNLVQLNKEDRGQLTADSAVVHAGAKIENSVVGAGASVGNPIRVRNSLIFAGSSVASPIDLDQMIVTPETVIDCRQYPMRSARLLRD
jgi:dTDP-glucose pyrophosphorylase